MVLAAAYVSRNLSFDLFTFSWTSTSFVNTTATNVLLSTQCSCWLNNNHLWKPAVIAIVSLVCFLLHGLFPLLYFSLSHSLLLTTTSINNASEVIFAAIQNQNFKSDSTENEWILSKHWRILELTSSRRIPYASLGLFAVEIFASQKLQNENCTQIISKWRDERMGAREREIKI